MEFFFPFLVGVVVGAGLVMTYGFYKLRRLTKMRTNILNELRKQAGEASEKISSYKERLVKVKELTEQQLDMQSQMEAPSKNSLHSKWKNDLGAEIRRIEDEKMGILHSILKDGFDPLLSIINANKQPEQLKLSEYLSRLGVDVDTWEEEELAKPGVKKVGKFIVYTGGGNDTVH
jgi:hypothetical protein